ncbi:hypothetical protein HanIR_Chr15g0774431 [Helianthus annuus]|nr:hypothetical protein HanIR_Chr15g0774431 [Helianthus annuus]
MASSFKVKSKTITHFFEMYLRVRWCFNPCFFFESFFPFYMDSAKPAHHPGNYVWAFRDI